MGAIAGQLVNIDEDGATSMMWHAMPYVMDFDPHSGDFGLGFFGHCLESGAYYVVDKTLGELCYLCDATAAASGDSVAGAVRISPRDSFHNRVFLEPLSLYLYAEAGTIDHVDFDLAGKKIAVVFAAAARGNATFAKIRLQVDKTSDSRPGSNFVVDVGGKALIPPPLPLGTWDWLLIQCLKQSTYYAWEFPMKLPRTLDSGCGCRAQALTMARGAYDTPPAAGGGATTIAVAWS
jgi:hypothetical protein